MTQISRHCCRSCRRGRPPLLAPALPTCVAHTPNPMGDHCCGVAVGRWGGAARQLRPSAAPADASAWQGLLRPALQAFAPPLWWRGCHAAHALARVRAKLPRQFSGHGGQRARFCYCWRYLSTPTPPNTAARRLDPARSLHSQGGAHRLASQGVQLPPCRPQPPSAAAGLRQLLRSTAYRCFQPPCL